MPTIKPNLKTLGRTFLNLSVTIIFHPSFLSKHILIAHFTTNVHQFIVLSFTQFLLRQTQKTMFQYGFFVVGSFIITD